MPETRGVHGSWVIVPAGSGGDSSGGSNPSLSAEGRRKRPVKRATACKVVGH